MMLSVERSEAAEADIRQAFVWWRDNRSSEQALRWYKSMRRAIGTLREVAERCPLAPETSLHPLGLPQLNFGISRRATHRIVFVIDHSKVIVYRVRHAAQVDLNLDDLP